MFQDVLTQLYPGAMPADTYLDRTLTLCAPFGIVPGNTLPMVGLCRDELVFDVESGISARWGSVFDLGSLAGMLFLGRTGLQAAVHHAPSDDGRRHFVVFAMPHIAIDADGSVGVVHRQGQDGGSTACGALVAFKRELMEGTINADLDPYDLEQSLLRQRLLRGIRFGEIPDLAKLTELTRQAMLDDLRALARELGDEPDSDVAVFTGTLVHGPGNVDWIGPAESFAVVDGSAPQPLDIVAA